MSDIKRADAEHPILDVLAERWSPYVFDRSPVPPADLFALFEAARWAASSYNEQPWRFVVARSEDEEAFERMLSCLVEFNRGWAERAPVLVLCLFARSLARSGKPNTSAAHDLGLAVGNLTVEAVGRGLSVHQMGGILPDRARELFDVPEAFEVHSALAIGTAGTPEGDLAEKDTAPRTRRPLEQMVFEGRFGDPLSG